MFAAEAAGAGGAVSVSVAALTINKVCGSGLKAIQLAASGALLGDHEVILAGGMESMTNAPYLLPKLRAGARMGHAEAKDSMLLDGLWCAMTDQSMGKTGELVVRSRFQLTEFHGAAARHFGGSYVHRLARAADGFRITLQRVDIVNARGAADYTSPVWA